MIEKIVQLNKKFFVSLSIILICFIADRISKIYVINLFLNNNLKDYYINSYLNIILLWNKGVAFGLFQSENFSYNLISILIFLIIIFIFYLIYNTKKFLELMSFSMIAGGALGNFFDRFYYNAVPDFIDLHFKNFHWFTFNVSDICISIGVIILILNDLFKNIKFSKNA